MFIYLYLYLYLYPYLYLYSSCGRQVLTYGKRTPPEELLAQINAVTASDLTSVAAALLKSPPSVGVYGDTTAVPRWDLLAAKFR